MKKKLDFAALRDLRKRQGLNQRDFWSRFGVTQSGGSRYETHLRLSKPLLLLLHLRHTGKITDKDLTQGAKALGWDKATVQGGGEE